MNSYDSILNELLRSIKERDGKKFKGLAATHKPLTEEGMLREGICQILAGETFWFRWSILIHHPKLILPYLIRIRSKKETK
jgi:hypothetical protein